MASTYITNGLTAGSGTIGTVSLWVKRAALGTSALYHFFEDNVTFCRLRFDSSDKLHWETYDNNTSYGKFKTNRLFRDTSAWYHIVVRVDTTQSTEADRFKLYVNGSEETSFSTSNYPTQNRDVKMTAQPYIGTEWYGSGSNYFDGIMSHIIYTDGQSYAASSFGSTDSTTGEWKINVSPSVTYGSKGFYVLKDGNGVTDQSGNGNNFTATGTLTITQDCPSNVFTTLNTLNVQSTGYTIANGNLSITGNTGGAFRTMYGTLGASSGKFYWEMKVTGTNGSDPMNMRFGIVDADQMDQVNGTFHNETRGYAYTGNSGNIQNGSNNNSYGNTYTTNDIIGCAVDLDNSKLYFSKNGTWQNSGDPTSGSTGTGAAATIASGYTYLPAMESYYNQDTYTYNFGNGYFGTTAISSEGTNASGIGKFEYDVPTGYTALSTKGLNE